MLIDYCHFDLHGNRLGYVDNVGHYFDPAGQYRGSLSQDGYLRDEYGAACGRVDAEGQMWDEEGSYRGYLVRAMEEDHRHQRLAAMGAEESE